MCGGADIVGDIVGVGVRGVGVVFQRVVGVINK